MTVTSMDVVYPPITPTDFFDYFTLVLLAIHFGALIYTLVMVERGKFINLKSSTGKWTRIVMWLYLIWELFSIALLYIDCPKIVSIIFRFLGPIFTLNFILGLLDILKGFEKGSKFINDRNIKVAQVSFCVIFVILIGPSLELFIFWNSVNALAIPQKYTDFMYGFHVILHLLYIYWQFGYMALYLKNFYDEIDRVQSAKRSVSMKKSANIIAICYTFCIIGTILWLYALMLNGILNREIDCLGRTGMSCATLFGN